MSDYNLPPQKPRPAFSLPSILACVCAIISFRSGALWGTLMAIAAIVLGVFGALLALSPRVRGGFVSVLAIGFGVLGIIAAIFKLVF